MRGSLDKINQEKNDLLQAIETESYQQLTKQIALGRKLSLTTTANWAEGKIFTGTQALALGLINELGSSATVTRVIKEKALIESEIEWIHTPYSSFIWGPHCRDGELEIKARHDKLR